MPANKPSGLYRHQVKRETEKAVGLEIIATGARLSNGAREESRSLVWFPKSKIEWKFTVYGDELWAPDWILAKNL